MQSKSAMSVCFMCFHTPSLVWFSVRHYYGHIVGMAKYMNKNVAGVFVPDDLIREMETTKDKPAKSIEIAARLIKELRPLCQGIHIMPIGWDKRVPAVLDAAGL